MNDLKKFVPDDAAVKTFAIGPRFGKSSVRISSLFAEMSKTPDRIEHIRD